MKKNKAQKDILYITISSFILVAAWIGFNLYHTWTTTTISEDLQIQIEPINPDFDTQTIQTLKTRTDIAPVNEIKSPITNNNEPVATPLSSQSANIQPNIP